MAVVDSIEAASKYISKKRLPVNRSGYLHKGHAVVAASASIPSKYQTIVISNNEKKGFNSCSKRFGSQQYDDESPGPAKYNIKQSLLKENHASFSKKGLGGFVSKVKRFPVPLYEDYSVGPGQYLPNLKSKSTDFNRANCTSNFHKPIAVSRDLSKYQTPAPNHYQLSNKATGHLTYDNNVAACAAFLSRTKRDMVTAKASNSVPAPCAYDINDKLTSSNPRATQAPFKSTTKRIMLPKTAMENPGPGTYHPFEPQLNTSEKKVNRKHYLCISAPAIPMPPKPATPGPGQYNLVNYEGPAKQYISSSMFVSTSNRWDFDNGSIGPGPATYNPRQPFKQSFMYNADQKWI